MSISITHCHKVFNALNTLVSRERPGFQALFKGLIVLLCAEVVQQGVPVHLYEYKNGTLHFNI